MNTKRYSGPLSAYLVVSTVVFLQCGCWRPPSFFGIEGCSEDTVPVGQSVTYTAVIIPEYLEDGVTWEWAVTEGEATITPQDERSRSVEITPTQAGIIWVEITFSNEGGNSVDSTCWFEAID